MAQELAKLGQVVIAVQDVNKGELLYFIGKRCLDVVLSAVMLVICSPVLLICAILIKLDSPGPVLFIQERVGGKWHYRNGKIIWERQHFQIYKLRSMVQNADPGVHQAQVRAFVTGQVGPASGADSGVKLANDARITRVGHFLRKTSFDELPQLLNVFKGEMSLVGPRPVPPYEVAEYLSWHYERLAALSGITGLWQVRGRGLVSFEEMMQMDIEYVRSHSLWLDLKILVLTLPAVLSGRGAE